MDCQRGLRRMQKRFHRYSVMLCNLGPAFTGQRAQEHERTDRNNPLLMLGHAAVLWMNELLVISKVEGMRGASLNTQRGTDL